MSSRAYPSRDAVAYGQEEPQRSRGGEKRRGEPVLCSLTIALKTLREHEPVGHVERVATAALCFRGSP